MNKVQCWTIKNDLGLVMGFTFGYIDFVIERTKSWLKNSPSNSYFIIYNDNEVAVCKITKNTSFNIEDL